MVMEMPDTSGIKVFVSFGGMFKFTAMHNDVLEKERQYTKKKERTAADFTAVWQPWVEYVVKHRLVQAWDAKDVDGNPLDPTKPEDYWKASALDFKRLQMAITKHINGVIDQAKN